MNLIFHGFLSDNFPNFIQLQVTLVAPVCTAVVLVNVDVLWL